MMVFGMDGRGKFRSVGVDTHNGKGIVIQIAGSGSANGPVGPSSLVTSFSSTQRENYSVSQCLNGGMYLYSFGHDPGSSQFTVGVTSFLMSCDGGIGEDFNTALSAYRTGRVSASKQLSSLSIGTGSLSGYLVGQEIAVADNALSMISATYTFVALKPQGG